MTASEPNPSIWEKCRRPRGPALDDVLADERKEDAELGLIEPGAGRYADAFTEDAPRCPVCGSPDTKRGYEFPPNRFRECGACEAIYRSPRLKREAFERLIAASQSVDRRVTANIQSFEGGVRNPAMIAILATLEALSGRSHMRYCDIGCRTGELVYIARERGWESWGVEPNELAAQFMERLGLNVRNAVFSASLFRPSSFDAVSLRHVIINMLDPQPLFRDINAVMATGGLLYFNCFNRDGLAFRLMGRRHASLHARNSNLVLGGKAIERLLSDNGFALVSMTTEEPDITSVDLFARVLAPRAPHRYADASLWRPALFLARLLDEAWFLKWVENYSHRRNCGGYYNVFAQKVRDI